MPIYSYNISGTLPILHWEGLGYLFIKDSMTVIADAIWQAKELCDVQPTGRYSSQCQRIQQKLSVVIPFLESLHKDPTFAKANLQTLGAMVLALSSARDAFGALNDVNASFSKLSDESAAKLVDEVCANVDLSLSKLDVIDKMDDLPLANADATRLVVSQSSLVGVAEEIMSGLLPPDTIPVDEIRDEVPSTVFINQNGPPRTTTSDGLVTVPKNAFAVERMAEEINSVLLLPDSATIFEFRDEVPITVFINQNGPPRTITSDGLVTAPKYYFTLESIGQRSGGDNDPEYLSDDEGAVRHRSGADHSAMDPVYVPTAEVVPHMMDPVHVPTQEELELQRRFEEFLLSADVSSKESRREAAHRAQEQFGREAIPSLLKVLSGGPGELRPLAAAVLRGAAAISDVIRQKMVDAGAIPLLVQLLREGTEGAKEAAGALAYLAKDAENRKTIAREGAILLLVQLLREGTEGAKGAAAGALCNLAADAENRITIAREGAIPLLVQLLREGTASAKEPSAGALRRLAGNAENRKTIAREGAIPLLVQLLREGTEGAKEAAAGAIWRLAVDAENRKTLAREGAIPLLVQLLRESTEGAKEAAAGALRNLAEDAENRITIAREGAIPLLVQLLREGTEGAKGAAAGALWNLAADAENRITFAREGAIPLLVQLLREGTDGAKKQAAGALMKLAVDAESRKIIAREGAIPLLVQLLREGIEDTMIVAASALAVLSKDASTAVQIYSENAVSRFFELLENGNDTIRSLALWTLCNLSRHHPPANQEIGSKDTVAILKDLAESGSELVRSEAQKLLNVLL